MDNDEKLEPEKQKNPDKTIKELLEQSADLKKRHAASQKKLDELKTQSDKLKKGTGNKSSQEE